MTDKNELRKFISNWNIKYPYDKEWRERHNIPFLSQKHREMVLLDILLEKIENDLYEEAISNWKKKKEKEEDSSLFSIRDKEYIPGYGNWLRPAEDSMTEEDQDILFDKIKF